MWTNKYQPTKFEEIAGNNTIAKKLQTHGWKKPIILYGQTGIGKTAIVSLLEENFDILWVKNENLSDIESISQTQSLFGKKKLLVFDNIETIGDIKKIADFLKETKTATILITSDFKSKKLATIKRMCEKLQMRKPMSSTIANLLERICASEGIQAKKELLSRIAENANGDIRAAITDLETITKGRKELSDKDLEVLVSRDKIGDIYSALSKILSKNDIKDAISSTYDLSEQPRDVLLWIDENAPKFIPDKENLSKTYHYLSRSDIFLGRILARQHWGFLRYANALMTAGVNVSKGERTTFSPYQFPFYIIHMSQTKKERNFKKSIAEKLSTEIHDSQKTIMNEFLPLYKLLLKKNKITREEFVEHFRISEEEMEFLSE